MLKPENPPPRNFVEAGNFPDQPTTHHHVFFLGQPLVFGDCVFFGDSNKNSKVAPETRPKLAEGSDLQTAIVCLLSASVHMSCKNKSISHLTTGVVFIFRTGIPAPPGMVIKRFE